MIKIKKTNYESLSTYEKKVLLSLTLRGYSGMRHNVFILKRYGGENHIIYIEKDNLIVGWSLLTAEDDIYHSMFYVRHGFRKMGYGRRLHKEVVKICNKNNKYPFIYADDVNRGFFYSLGYSV